MKSKASSHSQAQGHSASKALPCGRPAPQASATVEDAQALFESSVLRLRSYIEKESLKKSDAREKILETIIFESSHFRPQDLFDRVRQRYPEVGKATLYRTLPILIECGILQEGPADTDGQTLYELKDSAHHDHIVCLDCRRIFEFHDKVIEKRQVEVTDKLGFTTKSHQHVIYASCSYFNS